MDKSWREIALQKFYNLHSVIFALMLSRAKVFLVISDIFIRNCYERRLLEKIKKINYSRVTLNSVSFLQGLVEKNLME